MIARALKLNTRAHILIVSIWLTVSILGMWGGISLDKHLTTSLEIPGSSSAQANNLLERHFSENTEGTFTVLFKYKQASQVEIQDFKNRLANSVKIIPGAEITQEKAFAGTLYANITTSLDLNQASEYTKALRQALIKNDLKGSLVTGPPAIKTDVSPILSGDLHRGQIVAVLLALLLLVIMLGFSWAVLIPLIYAFTTISTSLGIIYLLARKFLMVLYVPNIVELIGLGLAIDYSLLMVHRYRQNKGLGFERLEQTMRTAGRTAIISALTVSMGLATLTLVPIPFVRSLGIACLVVPIVSIIATATLQPILLKYLGEDASQGFKGLLHRDLNPLTQFALDKPKRTLTLTLIAILTLLTSLTWLQVTPSSLSAIPGQLESARAINSVTSKVGVGVITPHEIIVDLGQNNQAQNFSSTRFEFAKQIASNPEVFTVASGEKWPYVDPSGRFIRLYIFGQHDLGAPETVELVQQLQNFYIPNSNFPKGTQILLGGAPAQGVDLLNALSDSLPAVISVILILTLLVLVLTFKSLVLAAKAIALDMLSIGLTFSALVLVFKLGFGVYQLQHIEAWVLILLFAILFGLSMDYEIFVVSRIREARESGLTNEDAIRTGLRNSATVVTASAIIFVTALTGLIFGHFAGLQQLGIGLAIGVLVDATVVRGLLLPSAMVLLGKWNWWLPFHKETPTLK